MMHGQRNIKLSLPYSPCLEEVQASPNILSLYQSQLHFNITTQLLLLMFVPVYP